MLNITKKIWRFCILQLYILFQDAMERVLLETGIGGVTAIHDYYQEYILRFEENMKKKVETMMEKQR